MDRREIEYWNTFYLSHDNINTNCSSFCEFIMNYFKDNKEIKHVLDCGCGNGRDSYALAKMYNVDAVDSCGFLPDNNENVHFGVNDFVSINKEKYDLVYSRFTFHSISNEQQQQFLDTICENSYLVIETRSVKGAKDNVYHGKTHFRNYTDLTYLNNILTERNYKIIYIKEDINMAKYKDENPVCIRVICKKLN